MINNFFRGVKKAKDLNKIAGTRAMFSASLAKASRRMSIKNKKKAYSLKDTMFEKFFEKEFNNVKIQERTVARTKKVWFFWWQGLENAPKEVVENFNRAKEVMNDWDVVIITKANVESFITIPDRIKYLLGAGKMTITAFSDYVRFSLLAEYGGLWVDSTILLLRYPDILSKGQNIVTAKGAITPQPSFYFENPSHYRWSIYFIGFRHDVSLALFVKNVLAEYWNKNDTLLDYFLTDYVFKYALSRSSRWQFEVDGIPNNNIEREIAKDYLETIGDFGSVNTDFIKLDRKKFPIKTIVDSQRTYYGTIIRKFEGQDRDE